MFRRPLHIQLFPIIHIGISPGQVCIPWHQIHPVTVGFLFESKEHVFINIVFCIHHLQIQPDVCNVVHIKQLFRFCPKRFIVRLAHFHKCPETFPVLSISLTISSFQFHSENCQVFRRSNGIHGLRQKFSSVSPLIEIFLI